MNEWIDGPKWARRGRPRREAESAMMSCCLPGGAGSVNWAIECEEREEEREEERQERRRANSVKILNRCGGGKSIVFHDREDEPSRMLLQPPPPPPPPPPPQPQHQHHHHHHQQQHLNYGRAVHHASSHHVRGRGGSLDCSINAEDSIHDDESARGAIAHGGGAGGVAKQTRLFVSASVTHAGARVAQHHQSWSSATPPRDFSMFIPTAAAAAQAAEGGDGGRGREQGIHQSDVGGIRGAVMNRGFIGSGGGPGGGDVQSASTLPTVISRLNSTPFQRS